MTEPSLNSEIERMIDPSSKEIAYSVVIPVYNEEESLKELFTELLQVMPSLKEPYEILFVDDCSDDNSLNIINEFKQHLPEAIRVIPLSERSGQTMALKEGLSQVKGRIVITLDADLQNDPADIPKLIQKLEGRILQCLWMAA